MSKFLTYSLYIFLQFSRVGICWEMMVEVGAFQQCQPDGVTTALKQNGLIYCRKPTFCAPSL